MAATCVIVSVLLPERMLLKAKVPTEKTGAFAVPVKIAGPVNCVKPSDVPVIWNAAAKPVPNPMLGAEPTTPPNVPATLVN